MNDDDLLRYSRHLLLDEIGIEGQRRVLAAHALVVGAGGLGSPALLFLGSAGVGRITIVDDDRVDLTNLQRQIAHDLSRVGAPKATSAAASITAINPNVVVTAVQERVSGERLHGLVAGADVVLLQRQLRDAAGHQRRLRRARQAPGRGRGDRLRRPGVGVRHAAARRALLRLCLCPRRRLRGRGLLDDGRVRAAGRDHRQHASGRGPEAACRRGQRAHGAAEMLERARWNGPS